MLQGSIANVDRCGARLFEMKRAVPLVALLALVAVACAPSAPPPALPEAGCYSAYFANGNIYFTGKEPTPWEPHNILSYLDNPDFDCSPAEPTSEHSGVTAANELEAWAKCNEQVGPTLFPPRFTAATLFHTSPDFFNIWVCKTVDDQI